MAMHSDCTSNSIGNIASMPYIKAKGVVQVVTLYVVQYAHSIGVNLTSQSHLLSNIVFHNI